MLADMADNVGILESRVTTNEASIDENKVSIGENTDSIDNITNNIATLKLAPVWHHLGLDTKAKQGHREPRRVA